MKSIYTFETVKLDDDKGALVLLDQTRLPGEEKYIFLKEQKEIWEAIYSLRVRGAPAIGIAAAYGAYLGIRDLAAPSAELLYKAFTKVREYLSTARPTAVNLFWALERMDKRFRKEMEKSPEEIKKALRVEAESIHREDEEVCRSIGEHSLSLLGKNWGLLTHCNAGGLAASKLGTALAPIYLGCERGYNFKVYADETRPLLQGARLTTWELTKAGVDVTLLCDNMASVVMKQGKIQAVLVGCDRVAANGDAANKIGTAGAAILAKYYGIPFYIHAPLSTVDMKCSSGSDITIEERPAEEVTEKWYSGRMAPPEVKVYNPAFDVTEASLITAIITEKGVAYPPYTDSLKSLF